MTDQEHQLVHALARCTFVPASWLNADGEQTLRPTPVRMLVAVRGRAELLQVMTPREWHDPKFGVN